MKTKKLLTLILVSLVLTGPGMNCSKDPVEPEPQLPEITTEGRGTLGFKKNDTIWLPETYTSAKPELTCKYSSDSMIAVIANIHEKNVGLKESLILHFRPVGSGKTSFILAEEWNNRGFFDYGYAERTYQTNKIYTGKVELLKFDPVNYIVAGTFELDAIDSTTNDTMKIREGRFDLIYY